jgi:hypothetical protein
MFKLNRSDTFTWPIEVSIPADGGKFVKETFDAVFERYSQQQIHDLRAEIEDRKLTDADFARRVVKGWRGVTEDGAEVPFSVVAFDQLLNVPNTAAAIVVGFMEAHAGATRKN